MTDVSAVLEAPLSMGERIHRLRRARRMSQLELSAELRTRGVPVANTVISKWETDTRRPDVVQLLALADVFEVKVWDLGAEPRDYPELELLRKVAATRA